MFLKSEKNVKYAFSSTVGKRFRQNSYGIYEQQIADYNRRKTDEAAQEDRDGWRQVVYDVSIGSDEV